MASEKQLKTKDLKRTALFRQSFENQNGYPTHEISLAAVVKQTTNVAEGKAYDPKRVVRLALRPLDVDGNVRHYVKKYVKDGETKEFSAPGGDVVDIPLEYFAALHSAVAEFAKKPQQEFEKLFQVEESAPAA